MDDSTDNHEVQTIRRQRDDTKASFSANGYAACIVTGAALFFMINAIVADKAPRWLWLVALGIVSSLLMTQERSCGVAMHGNIRNAQLSMIVVVVLPFRKLCLWGHMLPNIIFAIYIAGLLSLWLVQIAMTRHWALVWIVRSSFLAAVICISLAKPAEIARYLAEEGETNAIVSTLGFGLAFYWLRLSQVEFMWNMTTLRAVVMPFWIFGSDGVDVWRVVGFNAVVHSVSLLAFVAVSDRRYRTFSLEWIHTVTMENILGVACTAVCLALYCQLTSRMLIFALLLAGSGATILLVRKHLRQASTQRTNDAQPRRHTDETGDEALAIERFQQSYKPFVAWAIVCIIINFAFAVIFPKSRHPLICMIASLMVAVALRCYLVNSNNQGRARWLFGWLWVGCTIFSQVAVVQTCQRDEICVASAAVLWALTFAFLNVGGVPGLCRMLTLLVNAYMMHALAHKCWLVDDKVFASTTAVGGMLFGEIVGWLMLEHGRASATGELAANKCFQSSFKPFVAFSAISALLQLYLAASRPTLTAPCALHAILLLATAAGRWGLRAVADDSRARRLFGWGWMTVSICMMAIFAFTLQQQTPHPQFGTAVISGGSLKSLLALAYLNITLTWFLALVYLNVIGAPRLARWTMLCLMPVLVVCMPSSAAQMLLPLFEAMVVGEVLGQLWVQCRQMHLSSFIRWWSLAFEDEVKEREYVTKHFEESYWTMTVCCIVASLLSCVFVSYFSHDEVLAFSPLVLLLCILFLRVHTERTVPRERKRAYFGFGIVIITLLMSVNMNIRWTSPSAEAAPPLAVAAAGCGVMLYVVIWKLIYLPERHRQLVNLIISACSIAMSLWSTLGATLERIVVIAAVLFGELIAFTLDHKRRSSHQATDSLRQELHSKEVQMKFAVDTIPTPACIADDDINLVYANCAALSMFGYTKEELSGQHVGILIMPSFEEKYDDFVEQFRRSSVDSATRIMSREVQGRHHDGHALNLRLTIKVSPDRMFFMVLFIDLAAEKAHREMTRNRDIQKGIAERFKAACIFLSHEIRNQLYPQSMVLEDMRQQESQWEESIDMILGANKTITKMLNRVLDLAKWESGEFPIDSTLFPILRLFKAVALYAKAKGATVEGLASIQPTWHVQADEHLLIQAATNLVSNAWKFRDGKPVCVVVAFERISHEKGVILVAVKDEGRGMTPDQLSKVMMPFGQIRKAGEARSGTGLGLPLTKAMIEAGHQGTLTLASEGLGKGTKSTMRVPVQWEDENAQSREQPEANSSRSRSLIPPPAQTYMSAPHPLPPERARGKSKEAEHEQSSSNPNPSSLWWVAPHPGATADILVVDDAKMVRMMTTFAAKKFGLTFHEAADGTEAVELLRTNTYSMVFMDHEMPTMNGDEATEQARAHGYTLPIVMMSGNTFKESDESELKRRGVTALMGKMSVPGPFHAMDKLKKMKMEKGSTSNPSPLWWVAPHPGATADILVVDDVKLNRLMTARSAKKLGLTFHEAADGTEAVELLRTNTYSMVLMDNQMPVMNGDEATEQARANGYTLPIVMTSGSTFKESDESELKRRGVTALMGKMSVPGPFHAMEKLKKMK